MAVIYLVHDVHGAKVAISEEEAIYDEMYGWERYNPETPVVADVAKPAAAANEMAGSRRRGRARTTQGK